MIAAIASIGIALSLLSTASSMITAMARQPTITPAGLGIGGIEPERPPEGSSPFVFFVFNTGVECSQRGFSFFQCVESEYESSATIVLHGDPLLRGGLSGESGLREEYNNYLWKVVDAGKETGYAISSVIFSEDDIESNPYIYHVVMSKP